MLFKNFGIWELLIILAIVVIIFGVGRLGKLGKDLGEGISAFRKGLKGSEEEGAEEEEEEATKE
jgi:sec-independent protein translocase protein TatA